MANLAGKWVNFTNLRKLTPRRKMLLALAFIQCFLIIFQFAGRAIPSELSATNVTAHGIVWYTSQPFSWLILILSPFFLLAILWVGRDAGIDNSINKEDFNKLETKLETKLDDISKSLNKLDSSRNENGKPNSHG